VDSQTQKQENSSMIQRKNLQTTKGKTKKKKKYKEIQNQLENKV